MNLLRLMFALAVTVAWGVSVAVALVNPERHIDPWVHLMAAAIATALFGPSIWKRG